MSRPAPADVLALMAEARRPVCRQVRRRTLREAREVTVLAIMDALEDRRRHGATEAVRGLLARAGPDELAVLLEPVAAPIAHGVLESLTHAGLLAPRVAQVAHLRIDLRRNPDPDAR